MLRSTRRAFAAALALLALADPEPLLAQQPQLPGAKWCSGMRIRFFVGGAEGDAFASIILRGAQTAMNDLGPTVEFVFSGWNNERFVQQLREAIAARPDGIAMMGHPGAAALMPLAEEASKAGVLLGFQNVDPTAVRERFGGAYIGANLTQMGTFLGAEAIKRFELKRGDKAVVFANWANEARTRREVAVVKALEDAGISVVKVATEQPWTTDPNLMIPLHTATITRHADAKLVAYPGGQILGNVATFMETAGKKPGDYKVIGFDSSPRIIDAFDKGWIHLTADQQPYLQGYLPVLTLCQQKFFKLAPMVVDTGSGMLDPSNYKDVAELSRRGLR